MELLFSYGTLRLPAVQSAVFGGPVTGTEDAVVGHRLGEVIITDPGVIAASGSDRHPVLIDADDPAAQVEGTVFELDTDQLAAADAYEVDAYTRVRVPLRSGREAWVYALSSTDGVVGDVRIRGSVIDDQTRCLHYRGPTDVVAIRFRCCDDWYPCIRCHAEAADHPVTRWPRTEHDRSAVFCGRCRSRFPITDYLAGPHCPRCGADFNPGCVHHHHLYFEV